MRVLVTGSAGQLGKDVMKALETTGHLALGVDVAQMDITSCDCVNRVFESFRPDAVVHCAAWTAVDAAQEEENRERVRSINATGTRNIAEACARTDCKMLYISTDYVFDGEGETPWQPDDMRNPLNFYGQTKYEGELCVEQSLSKYFIVRIAWVFGIHGKNFVKTMLSLADRQKELRIVNDQIGTPTYTVDLSKLLVHMIESEKYGRYHATNEGGYISWYEFAQEIFRQGSELLDEKYGDVRISPVSSKEYASKAKRPSNSRLCKEKLRDNGFALLPDWKDALKRFLLEIKDSQNEKEE